MSILDMANNTMSTWGIPLPEQPVALVVTGNGSLAPGIYRVCYTNVVNGLIGGNGMIAEVEVVESGSAIQLLNLPSSDVEVWATDPNGNIFYRVPGGSAMIGEVPTVEPLSTFMCYPPSPMRFIRRAFGRMWGVIDDRLLYSEPYRYDLYKATNEFSFKESEIRLTAFVDGGIYLGFTDRTVFLKGTEPAGMSEANVGPGVAKNILAYCNNVPDMGNNIPIWVSKEGLVAGSHGGQLAAITQNKVQMPAGEEGTAVSRTINGQNQFLASFKQARPQGSGVGFGDSATCEVVRNGKVL